MLYIYIDACHVKNEGRKEGRSVFQLAIYIEKYLKAKEEEEEELWKLNYISACKNIIFRKCSKKNQNPSRYHNSITNLKFQPQAKISPFKNPHIKIYRPIIIIIT